MVFFVFVFFFLLFFMRKRRNINFQEYLLETYTTFYNKVKRRRMFVQAALAAKNKKYLGEFAI